MNYNSNENPSLENVLLMAIAEALRNTHTSLIAKVTKVNQKTINCIPVISRVVNDEKIDLPEFAEVPILNFLGGSSSIQMPISVGDYCILFVSERCFDGWYNGQDFEKPLEARIHDYSDSIAFVGLKNKDGELDIPTVITMLGDAYQKGDYVHEGDRDQTGDYTLTGDQTINGNLQVNGNITCTGTISAANFSGLGGGSLTSNVEIQSSIDVKSGSISLNDHTHTSNGIGNETSTSN
ncbi:Gp138 family membrane-puncturing spike protein [Sulfurimonas sp.]|uniref:Gp138 family membrane-puncturing spike protein n=1 Tax=Sulfurimonas sp. TaxID=2022749 RepID=UPI003564F08B